MIHNNQKFIGLLTSFSNIEATLHVHKDLIKSLKKEFKKIYIINIDNLFIKKNKSKRNNVIKNNKNIIFFNPKNFNDFNLFLDNKKILIISNFGRTFNSINIHFFLKSRNIKLVQISNLGFLNNPFNLNFKKNFFKSIIFYINNTLSKKIINFLGIIRLIPQLEVRFLSNKSIMKNINKNMIKKFLYDKKLFYTKKIILINSRSYDALKTTQLKKSEKYIIHLDSHLNWPEEVALRGRINQKTILNHYKDLNLYLANLSKLFKKKVIVCIHPDYNLNLFKRYFKNFNVIQFKTREFIYSSFLVTVFDSSAISDAILLNKNVIGLYPKHLTHNEKKHALDSSRNYGYPIYDMSEKSKLNKKKILNDFKKSKINFLKYSTNYHIFDKKISGYQQIINELKIILKTI